MRICSFVQTCSNELLEAFVQHCSGMLNTRLTINKIGGRIELHDDSVKDKEAARRMSEVIEQEFYKF